jgi:hypothetical protein
MHVICELTPEGRTDSYTLPTKVAMDGVFKRAYNGSPQPSKGRKKKKKKKEKGPVRYAGCYALYLAGEVGCEAVARDSTAEIYSPASRDQEVK